MAHFADGKWNNVTGMVAAASGAPSQVGVTATVNGIANVEIQSATGVDAGAPALFTNSATPVTLVTFTVPRAGMYQLFFYMKTAVAGTGAGQVCAFQAAYNDGTAVAATSIAGSNNTAPATPATTVDALTLNAILQGGKQLFCAAGSTITLSLLGSGTITTPASIQSYWAIEAV